MSVTLRAGENVSGTDTHGFASVVDGLRKRYGSLVAVDGISFRVKEREIFGLLGPNGAGKTTTVEILEGLRTADDGQVLVAGIDVRKDPEKVKSAIGVQLQSSAFFDGLNLMELLDMFAALYGRTVDAMAILKKVDLAEKARSTVPKLSGGQKQRFSIATALVNEPQILFLDEPTTGLDPQARRNLWELAASIRAEGRTIVLTTHYMDEAETLCDRVAIMDHGKILAMEPPDTMIQRLLDKGFHKERVERSANLEDVFVAVRPASIGTGSTAIAAFYNQGNPQGSQVAIAIMNQFVDQTSFALAGISPALTLDTRPVQSRNLTYVDFLVPGMIALSIMQTGLFGVVFTFVQWKQRGILRRLMATPMRVRDFFFSQLVTRLTTVALQIVVLLAVGFFVFHFHFAGNVLYLLIVGIIGGGIFLAMGLAISGASKSEETAAPIANLVSLPLMFLSGIFFSRSNMPEWLQTVTQYSPLTYVSDALRSISIDGASLWAVRSDLLGIFIWLAITVVLATRLFKWEVV